MDQVRSKVLEEGRDAKNLFAFHIFINDDSKIGTFLYVLKLSDLKKTYLPPAIFIR